LVYSVALPLEIWRDDTEPEPPIQATSPADDWRFAEKPAPVVVAYDPVALPPEAKKPLSVLLTLIVPATNVTLVGEAPDHFTTRMRLSEPTFSAKLAHEFVPVTLIVAVTFVGLTGLPLEEQPLKVIGLIVLFSFEVPVEVSGGLKVTVAPRPEQVAVPFAALADAPTTPTKLTKPVVRRVARTPIASFFI